MTSHLHEFVPTFTLYLNIENAPSPAEKHFDKTNSIICQIGPSSQIHPTHGLNNILSDRYFLG